MAFVKDMGACKSAKYSKNEAYCNDKKKILHNSSMFKRGGIMKNNSVVFFTDHIEKYTRLAEMLESNVSLSVCSYSSESSWEDIDFYSGRNVCFVLDEIPEDKNAIWIISKLFEDNLFAEVPILFTSYDAMYEFDKMGFASFAYDVLPEPFDY